MSQKVLPLAEPPYKGYQHLAFPLSVALTSDGYLPWFYSNYIQTFFVPDANSYNIVFPSNYEIPWDYHLAERHHIIDLYKCHLTQYIINFINDNYYIETDVDMFYIPHRNAYKKYHFYHQILIYGYDDERNTFYISGYDETMHLNKTEVSEQELLDSSFKASDNILFHAYRPKIHSGFKTDIDFELLKRLINDYLNSVNTIPSKLFNVKGYIYGLESCNALKNYAESLINNHDLYDIRPFHLFWEHKKCMRMRFKYFRDREILTGINDVYNSLNIIETDALSLRNLLLKFKVKNDGNIIKHGIDLIDKIKEQEKEELTIALNML